MYIERLRTALVFISITTLTVYSAESKQTRDGREEAKFTAIFDGKSLKGWRSVPATNIRDWTVRGRSSGMSPQSKTLSQGARELLDRL